jgi:hypothetical protein
MPRETKRFESSPHLGLFLLATLTLFLTMIVGPAGARAADPVTVTNYTDPAQTLAWGTDSHWKQPWRSYMDTVPAKTLLNAIGINFNVKAAWADTTATLLKESGFKRARIEVSWRAINYEHPDRMNENEREDLVAKLTALRENGLKPLIILNSNHGDPCPIKDDTIQLTAPVHAGDTQIHVNPLELGKIILNRTGVKSGGVAAQYLFKSISPEGTVGLSAPLGSIRPATGTGISELPAGALNIETLRYEPFHPARREDGSPNRAFEPTLQGWLNYVGVVTREVKSILGSEDFDVEVWNELSFGSRFLNINNYYSPPLEYSNGVNPQEILARTVEYIRNPANGAPKVGIGDGFANQAPTPSAANTPVGLTAIDKHPYPKVRSFPRNAEVGGNRPLNGLGELSGEELWNGGWREWRELFTPTYEAFFPEYFLAGIQTETLIHDLSPVPTKIAGVEHGRYVHAPGGQPTEEWITELNLNPATGLARAQTMSAADIRHIETKAILRSLVAYVNKGVTAIDFFAARAGNLSLVDSSFFGSLQGSHPTYPGDAAGGETTTAVGRLAEFMDAAGAIASPRSLSLKELTDLSSNVQFAGNGTTAFPPLFNRDVFAFFPFQASPRRFVAAVYVMTRDMAKVYGDPNSGDPGRYDLPPEPYRMDIGGVDGETVSVSALDPVSGDSVPATIIDRGEDDVTVEMPVTDSPRLLSIEETGAGVPEEEPVDEGEGPGEGPGDEGEGSPEPSPEPPSPPDPPVEHDTGHPQDVGVPTSTTGDPNRALLFQLRDRRALLRKQRVKVLARCASRCALSASGSLTIAGRDYALQARPATALSNGAPERTILSLLLAPRVGRLARAALERGANVRLSVVLQGHFEETGEDQSRRRRFSVQP